MAVEIVVNTEQKISEKSSRKKMYGKPAETIEKQQTNAMKKLQQK